MNKDNSDESEEKGKMLKEKINQKGDWTKRKMKAFFVCFFCALKREKDSNSFKNN